MGSGGKGVLCTVSKWIGSVVFSCVMPGWGLHAKGNRCACQEGRVRRASRHCNIFMYSYVKNIQNMKTVAQCTHIQEGCTKTGFSTIHTHQRPHYKQTLCDRVIPFQFFQCNLYKLVASIYTHRPGVYCPWLLRFHSAVVKLLPTLSARQQPFCAAVFTDQTA